ncbi:MAG: DNA-processing protein DprA [candidate division Zixibacteria bacterium]|nr:DNA-processing protein DprA [candidate division Zixibacteria bacterium]
MRVTDGYSLAAMVWALRHYGDVGPRTFGALMAYFETVAAVFQAELEELLGINGLGEKRAGKIFRASDFLAEAERFIGLLPGMNINCATIYDSDYPSLFFELNDPPPMIFYRGTLPQQDEKRVALIGSRNVTAEGIQNAVTLAEKLAEQKVSVVSGLAQGIDAAAHVGALKGGANSYAIIGSGLDHITPKDHFSLAVELIHNGAVISEYAPDVKTSPARLISRNRLTVGMSQAVVVGEISGDSTGTVDCAKFCNQLGKLTFVLTDGADLPGRDNTGLEQVLKTGAIPITMENGVDMITRSLV